MPIKNNYTASVICNRKSIFPIDYNSIHSEHIINIKVRVKNNSVLPKIQRSCFSMSNSLESVYVYILLVRLNKKKN